MRDQKTITTSHKDLVMLADKWLKAQSFKVVIRDCFRAYTEMGEQPDVIAWRGSISTLVECKTSRSDFLADKQKKFRIEGGMGDWRFFLSPPDVILPDDLPEGWGLLYAQNGKVKKIKGFPANCYWFSDRPFEGNKFAENQMLISALRRFAVRGQFDVIYEKLPEAQHV